MRGAQVRASVGSDPTGTLVPAEGNFFATSATIVDRLLAVEAFAGVVWEPACGNGAISRRLETRPEVERVVSSDLHDRGYGATGIDFLSIQLPFDLPHDLTLDLPVDHVVTNPPFDLAEAFAHRALAVARGKVALFARLAWLEGQTRHRTLWLRHPPARVWVFPDRVKLARNGGVERSGLIAFAWFVWERGHTGEPRLGWLPRPSRDQDRANGRANSKKSRGPVTRSPCSSDRLALYDLIVEDAAN